MAIQYRDLPGPKGWPIIGNLFQFKLATLHQYLERCALDYGDVFKVKLGPGNFTVVAKPELIQSVLKARPYQFRRMSKMDKILQAEGVHGVFNAEGEDWAVHRRIVNKGLNIKHQKQYFPAIIKTLDRLFAKMQRAAIDEAPYVVQDDLVRFTVDVTTSLAFGFEMNTLEQKGGVIQEHMEKIFPMIFKRINAPLPLHKIYRTKEDKAYDQAFVEIEKQVKIYIEAGRQRLKDNPALKDQPNDIIEALIAASDEEAAISDKEIKGNLLTLLLAGEDTTAHSLAWALFMISQDEAILQKLQQEADQHLGDDHILMHYDGHDGLKYTNAVIQETLRTRSVAPILLLEPFDDIDIEGYHFEKGSKMIVLTRFGAINDAYFSAASEFNPDRWLDQGENKCPVHKLSAMMPFGAGPRMCPGKHLALLEMKLVLSMIAKNFHIELITPCSNVKENLAFTMMPEKFEIRLKRRSG